MIQLPPFNEQYNKIIDAYFKNEIKPFSPEFCFCGTLHNGRGWEFYKYRNPNMGYTGKEYGRMEKALFSKIPHTTWVSIGVVHSTIFFEELESLVNYEDSLFEGMVEALNELKLIHQEHGEIINDKPEFSKRTLIPTI